MLQFVYGCPGSGKSRYLTELIAKRLEMGKNVILIVPERFSVTAEQRVIDRCSGKNNMHLDVLSFKRLCNRVFREYGGLCYNYAGKGGKILMMYRALCGVREELSVYKDLDLRDGKTVEAILDGVVSFKRAALSPEIFEKAGKDCADNSQLSGKVRDFAKIWREYERLLTEKYDDPEEDLTRLCALLKEHPFFADKEVFIDSTVAFTGQQTGVLKAVLAQSPCVTVAFNFLPRDERPMFTQLRQSRDLLLSIATEFCLPVRSIAEFKEPYGKSGDLAALEKYLFADAPSPAIPTPNVRADVFPGVYEECKAIAARILADVQNGGRFMHHAVAVRNIDDYKGIIDEVFESNGIPYTMTDKVNLDKRAAGRLVLCAMRLAIDSFRIEDLIEYLKTGYSGLRDDECFKLEAYVNLWQIEGQSRWLSPDGFMMNPEGHTAMTEDRQFQSLEEINELRKRLTEPLEALCQDFSACKTVVEFAEALFVYIGKMHLEGKLLYRAEKCGEEGDGKEAQLHSQTFEAICKALDEAVFAMGDCDCDAKEFYMMLEILFRKKQLATIPAGKDRVLVSDVFDLSPSGVETLYAAGLIDGVFPSTSGEKSMFTPGEAATLRELKVELPGSGERRVFDEEYLCYTALTLPRKKLYVSSCAKNLRGEPVKSSGLFEEIAEFCQKGEKEKEDLLYGRANCLEAALQNGGGEKEAALRTYFEKKSGEAFENIGRAPLVASSDALSADTAKQLYEGKPLRLSQSRLESFVNCPFSYTCRYILRLKEKAEADIQANETGTTVHAVFERLIDGCIENGEKFGALDDDAVKERVSAIVDDIRKETLGRNEDDVLYGAYYERVKRTAEVLALNLRDEFAQSAFEPAYCELSFGQKGGEGAYALPDVAIKGESNVTLHGTADRVDVFKKGGDVYLRVVDYKTGEKTFYADAVDEGLNAQMMLYLKALKECGDKEFLKKLGVGENGTVKPAGVLYFIAKEKSVEANETLSDDEIRKKIRSGIKRSGLLIDDKEILEAMEKGLGGVYIPYKAGAKENKSAIPADKFEEKLDGLDRVLSDIAGEMRSGKADATPGDKKGARTGCEYCPMEAVCRAKTDSGESDD